MTSPRDPDPAEAPPPSGNGRRAGRDRTIGAQAPRSRLRRRLLAAAAVAVAGAWVVALVYSVSRPDPEPLDPASERLVREACTDARDALVALPTVTAAAAPAEIAGRVRAENEVFADLVARARQADPDDRDGAIALDAWLDDWEAVVAARDVFADGLTEPDPQRMRLPVEDGGAPVTNRMRDYAEFHRLDACTPDALALETVAGERRYPE